MAAGYALARAGYEEVTVVERGSQLGGLAGSFERAGHFYPLGYHHILYRDRCLLYFLDLIGVLPRVRWRKVRMLFQHLDRLYDLARPADFLRFPLALRDKLRLAFLMLRVFRKDDWSEWQGRGGRELLDSWVGPRVRETLFDPLIRMKFGRDCEGVSAAWLGTRLFYREGSAPLGYVPQANWTTLLCDGLTEKIEGSGCRIRLRTSISELETDGDRVVAARTADGERITADVFVSALPTEIYTGLVPADATPHLERIRYTSLISVVCASKQVNCPDFYWMNLSSMKHTACAIFLLSSLNPTIGEPGESCFNFITHLPSRDLPLFSSTDEEILDSYLEDFRTIFKFELEPSWTHVSRIPIYSPIFDVEYANPPAKSRTWRNVYFAGVYHTFPSVASTGDALQSGLTVARAVLRDHGADTNLPDGARAFRLKRMPRG